MISNPARLHACIEAIGHVLPDQRPLEVFVHHNTLHAFEDLPFHEALRRAASLYGATPYLPEREFAAALAAGRVRAEHLSWAVERWLRAEQLDADQPISGLVTWRELLELELGFHAKKFPVASLPWALEEGLVPPPGSDSALFQTCLSLATRLVVASDQNGSPRAPILDSDPTAESWLIRLAAAFLDRGAGAWTMPDRDQGFFDAVRGLTLAGPVGPSRFARALRRRFAEASRTAEAELVLLLPRFSVRTAAADAEPFLRTHALALPGWAGMFHRLERHPTERPSGVGPVRLIDYLTVRLLLELAAREGRGQTGALVDRAPDPKAHVGGLTIQRALRLLFLFQHAEIRAERAAALDLDRVRPLLAAMTRIDSLARSAIWQDAYERHFAESLAAGLAANRNAPSPGAPSVQVFTCLDDRSESLRRHLEERDPSCETFGVPGFFGLAISFRGLDDGGFAPFCPVVMSPSHQIDETAIEQGRSRRRQTVRRIHARLQRMANEGALSLVRGSLLTFFLGLLAAFPLIARIVMPRLSQRLFERVQRALLERPDTRLLIERTGDLSLGFSVEEMRERVEGVLRGAGLVTSFAPLVVMLGHGSTSANNPHRSAYDCGACGGRRGGANARSLAVMANHAGVRKALRAQGIDIPDGTWFVGGEHDTASDDVTLYDLDLVPATHQARVQTFVARVDQARQTNAQERVRRFTSVPSDLSPEEALAEVEGRTVNLAEARPEYNHATNAACIIGRRRLTRGLFLDRRSFLSSYDPTIDPKGDLLAQQLGAVIPICVGINLEYYFSTVDNEMFGCGSKLPHNLTGHFGVMNGHESDLRTGLWKQTVEIHEPMRLCVMIEAERDALEAALGFVPDVRGWLEREWWHLIRVSPSDPGVMERFVDGGFSPMRLDTESPPMAASSAEAHRGRRGAIPPVLLRPGAEERTT